MQIFIIHYAESDHVYAPTIRSGRMYLSYGKPVYVKFVGSTGYAGPDLNNPGDVNANTLFEFAELLLKESIIGEIQHC